MSCVVLSVFHRPSFSSPFFQSFFLLCPFFSSSFVFPLSFGVILCELFFETFDTAGADIVQVTLCFYRSLLLLGFHRVSLNLTIYFSVVIFVRRFIDLLLNKPYILGINVVEY